MEIKKKFSEKYGIFVTLNEYKANRDPLRGCIGYIEPVYSLYEGIHRVSISSAVEDFRFRSVTINDMDKKYKKVKFSTL